VTYRIQRSTRPGSTVFVLSGVLDADHAARLGELLATEPDVRIVIDLRSVTLVDRSGVYFLARAQAAGAEIVNCPEYVRSWMATKEDSQ
jgi:anti-anti-sigma regulatory factor